MTSLLCLGHLPKAALQAALTKQLRCRSSHAQLNILPKMLSASSTILEQSLSPAASSATKISIIRYRSTVAATVAAPSREDGECFDAVIPTTATPITTTAEPTQAASKCPFSRNLQHKTAPEEVVLPSATAATSTLNSAATTEKSSVKTFRELNGPPAWPLFGNFLMYIKKKNRGRLHEALAKQHEIYGSMFREKMGFSTQLHVCDPLLMEQIYRSSTKYPIRPPIMAWRTARQQRNRSYGLVTSMEGEYWSKMRRLVNEKMLTPIALHSYVGDVNDVTNQMVSRLGKLRDTRGTHWLTSEMVNEFYKWSLEAAGLCILESRLGCLTDDIPEKARQFIAAIHDMMSSSIYLIVLDGVHKKLNSPFWRRHVDAWDRIFSIAKTYIDQRVEEIVKGTSKNGYDGLVGHLLQSGQLTDGEIYSNLTEILIGGTDTTANTLSFTLDLLARHPHVQTTLRQEVEQKAQGIDVTIDNLNSMPYMHATIKESMRLFPVGTMNVRILEKDLMLNDYLIPKKTLCVLNHYAAGRNENIFDNANDFRPERWLQGPQANLHTISPFAVLPFGYGIRGCIGKRLALMEMKIALVKILRQYDLKPVAGMTLKPYLRTLLTPGSHIPIEFIDRK